MENPNADSMRYFCKFIWPHVRDATSSSLIVVGYGSDAVVGDLKTESVRVLGAQEDLTPFYNAARVFIIPTRYAAGIPYKAHEAAAHGVPMVVSDVIAHQLKWQEEKDYLVAGNPEVFAESCCRLYNNQQLWQTLRSNALVRVSAELGERLFADALTRVISRLSTLGVGKVRPQASA
jgi:glycosyltransferase involved in cell wall biosynthesis